MSIDKTLLSKQLNDDKTAGILESG